MSEVLNEHQRLNKDGDVLGIYRIDTKNVRGVDVWAKLDVVIQTYTRIHPEEMKTLLQMNINRVQSQKNEFGSGKKLRWGISIPAGLLMELERIEPKLFENKKLYRQFMNKYKGFRVCSKV